MKSKTRMLFMILCVVLAGCLSGCGGGGGGGGGYGSVGINQIAIRSAIAPQPNVLAAIREAAVAVPVDATVGLYQSGVLVAGPQAMGTGGVVFSGLSDGTFSVRLTVGGRIFQTTKTVSSTRTALVARWTYFSLNGVGVKVEEAVDADANGEIGAGETVARSEFSAGSTTEAGVQDAIDVTNWGADLISDKDGDGLPNAFDEDVDGDGVTNSDDSDIDNDGSTNDADADDDGDGVADASDTQPSGAGTTMQLFSAPAGFQTAGFPAVTTTLTIPGFAAPKKSAVVLVNTTAGSLDVSVSANGTGIVTNRSAPLANQVQISGLPSMEGLLFQARLRERGRSLPQFKATPGVRPNVRPSVTPLGTAQQFLNPWPGSSSPVTAILKNRYPQSATGQIEHWVSDQIAEPDLTTLLGHIDQVNALWGGASGIYPKVRNAFGSEPPAGAFNGLTLTDDITVLWLPPNSNIAGFFSSEDLYSQALVSGATNERKMFYMHLDKGGEALQNYGSTFAHEFQHMINFYQRKLKSLSEDAWLDEAMSGYAEHVAGYSIVSGTNASKARLVLSYFGNVEADPLTNWVGGYSDYGQVFLFGLWLAEKYGTNGVVIQGLLTQNTTGINAVAAFTGKAFKDVLTEWLLALYINDTSGATKYGYAGFNLKGTYGTVALSGPTLKKAGSISVAPNAAAYIEVTAPAVATTLTWTVPSSLSVFELNK